MLVLRTALLLPLLAIGLWAAPLIKYDQRQDGDLNAQVHLENFVILLIPGGLRGFNIAAKVAPGRVHNRKHAHAHAHTSAQAQIAHAHSTPGLDGASHGLKAAPYRVDIDTALRPPPLVLEISPVAADEQHEVVIAESPAVVLAKKPAALQAEEAADEPAKESAAETAAEGEDSPIAPAVDEMPAVPLAPPKADPAPSRVADKLTKPAVIVPAPAIAAAPVAAPAAASADKPKRPAATPVSADKPKRPVLPTADKPRRPAAPSAPVAATAVAPAIPVAAPAAASVATPVAAPAAAPAPAQVPATAPVPTPAPAAPSEESPAAASESEPAPAPVPAPAKPTLSSGDRAARVAALGVGLEAHPAAGNPCPQGSCVYGQDAVGAYQDSLLKALSFGLEPAY